MKKQCLWNSAFRPLALALLILLLLGCTSRVALKKDQVPSETVVGRFSLEMTLDLDESEEPATHPLQIMISGAKVISQIRELMNLKQNAAWRAFVDTIYHDCTVALQQGKGLRILPIESLRGQAKYDAFGYPRGEPAVLAASGKYPSVLGLVIDVRFFKEHLRSRVGQLTMVRPHLTLALQLFDHTGKILWLDTVTAKAKQLAPIRWPRYYYTSETFFSLVREMVREALEKLLSR